MRRQDIWLLLLLLSLSLFPAITSDSNQCPNCTADNCDRLHDHRTDLLQPDVLKRPPPMTSDARFYYDNFGIELTDRIKADGGSLYGPRTRNLLHYTWAKIRACREAASTEFIDERNRIYKLLMNFRAVHTGAHYIQDRLPQTETEFAEHQYDPTRSIENSKVRQLVAERHLFGWKATTVEKAQEEECVEVRDFLEAYEQTRIFCVTHPQGSCYFSVEWMQFWKEHFLVKAKERFGMEEVRESLDANVTLLASELCKKGSLYLKRLTASLFYVRMNAPGNATTKRKDIRAEGLLEYLHSAGITVNCPVRDQLKRWIRRYQDGKWNNSSTPSWFSQPARFDRRLRGRKIYGEIYCSKTIIRKGRQDSFWADCIDFGKIICAIDLDYSQDGASWSKEKQLLRPYYTKMLLVGVQNGLLWRKRPVREFLAKYQAHLGGGAILSLIGAGVGGYHLYKWLQKNDTLPVLPSWNITTAGPLEPLHQSIIAISSEATAPPSYSWLVIPLIVLLCLVVATLLIAAGYYLYLQAKQFSTISLDSAAETTAIRVGIKVDKTATTSSTLSTSDTAKAK